MAAGLSIAERRELKARADVRHGLIEAWNEQRPFSILDKHLPRLAVGKGQWRRRHHPMHSFGE